MPSPTILVIDDDKLTRWSVSMILGRADYQIQEATSGEEGLRAVRAGAPDLVLLDISLPDQDGLSVLKAIRQLRPDLPVLMMSADATSEVVHHALRLGARGHLDKPCDRASLEEAVRRALQSGTTPSQSSG